ncbi:bacillithiol biosynthesis deacetylase BshB1 [Aureliella helgolandensis]|uniref:1D-myo-inositol 2-acetamido-2-deoxy-alpha-D-glucopyranoside deacetylase n=1 Tax=Aureliella helgolandensis TaxID=2527968 RepID=A0A518GCA1_9BACT|nr:bacillithiol biosynthesis deacetylase BshB1 [Aureliella helgolandensis]QDV26177.1 1D-myo-inositol 2-acetamido-2-deoxy-alpha-D-glucopyranoside deacetylase [Aureliella helgolandensis]
MPPKPLDMLVIAPHPDDAELGMGGAILKMIELGWHVGVLDLTSGEPTPYGDEATRVQETKAATQILGLPWRENLGLRNRFLEPTLEARAKLANVFRRTRPRWLFAPYWEDAHPDHLAATELVDAARFWAKLSKSELEGEPFHPQRIFNYYSVHLKHAAQPAFVLDISEQWERKSQAIAAFESQFTTGKEHIVPSFHQRVRDEAAYWGKMIGSNFGEPFTSREPIALTDLTRLM